MLINGALSTSTFSKIILTNGAKSKNIFWKVDGAVNINDSSIFIGTIICNNGAISLHAIDTLIGRALTTDGSLTSVAISTTMPPGCGSSSLNIPTANTQNKLVSITPNPFSGSITITATNASPINTYQLSICNMLGIEVRHTTISNPVTGIETNNLAPGIYVYKVIKNNATVDFGKIIAE
jgi:hypothetical protein